ncbi:MAG TPA: lysophospholipid acyltransferase family protein [Patescibacteria group bacterium]|nr:lysophospholipid acyltransferase family protein [Patescibacteria group bacterium]
MMYWLGRSLCALVSLFYFPITACGREHIPRKGGFIIATNHASFLDPVAVGIAATRRLNFMARHTLFSNPVFGWILLRVGAFPVKRGSTDISAIKEAIRRVKNGGGLLLFPEGTRSQPGEQLNPRAGIGFLVEKLAVPVIPAFIDGTQKALPKGAKRIKREKVTITFGRPLALPKTGSREDVAQAIMDSIRALGGPVSAGE